ncbi:MAG: MBL fold metallo-hydrolase [Candidatus Micrarchaeota archaeon]
MQIPCNGLTIGLDSSKGDIAFLSHAHSDHTNGLKRHKQILSTKETLELANLNVDPFPHPSGVETIEAGHILGAKQLVVDNDGEKIVYTGDICVKPNIFGMKAEIPKCDRLIMEATYGNPRYVFPPVEDVHQMVHQWINENKDNNLIIGCYELGKAQEMIKILNECGVSPIVPNKTEHFCSIYEKYGVKLDRIEVGTDEAEETMKKSFVSIVPMNRAKRYFAYKLAQAFERPTFCAVATGWALHHRFDTDAAFPLSDHADFNDLVDFVEQSEAKKVDFFCGDGSAVLKARRGVILNS